MKRFALVLLILTSNIYSETINMHTLPPEPDPKINNSTLLGIDSNNNGVRDDVERKVYRTYSKAIDHAVLMQAFKSKQKMLADPDRVKNARIWEKELAKYIDCSRYLYLYKNQQRLKRSITELTLDWQLNTFERIKVYLEYDQALSGGVYTIKEPKLQDCEFDVEKVLEMDQRETL